MRRIQYENLLITVKDRKLECYERVSWSEDESANRCPRRKEGGRWGKRLEDNRGTYNRHSKIPGGQEKAMRNPKFEDTEGTRVGNERPNIRRHLREKSSGWVTQNSKTLGGQEQGLDTLKKDMEQSRIEEFLDESPVMPHLHHPAPPALFKTTRHETRWWDTVGPKLHSVNTE